MAARIVWHPQERRCVREALVKWHQDHEYEGATPKTIEIALRDPEVMKGLEKGRKRVHFSDKELKEFADGTNTALDTLKIQQPQPRSQPRDFVRRESLEEKVDRMLANQAVIQATLRGLLEELKTQRGDSGKASNAPATLLQYAPQVQKTPPTPMIPGVVVLGPVQTKTRVIIAGVHGKHRHDIETQFPKLDIRWLNPHDTDQHLKMKASNHKCIVCMRGVNEKVINTLRSIAGQIFLGNGVSFVVKTLKEF